MSVMLMLMLMVQLGVCMPAKGREGGTICECVQHQTANGYCEQQPMHSYGIREDNPLGDRWNHESNERSNPGVDSAFGEASWEEMEKDQAYQRHNDECVDRLGQGWATPAEPCDCRSCDRNGETE